MYVVVGTQLISNVNKSAEDLGVSVAQKTCHCKCQCGTNCELGNRSHFNAYIEMQIPESPKCLD